LLKIKTPAVVDHVVVVVETVAVVVVDIIVTVIATKI
jgi:hypothetical protein